MGYDLIKKGRGNKGGGTENLDLDYKLLVFKQIERINMARTMGRFDLMFFGIDALSDFLEPYASESTKYQTEIKKIVNDFNKEFNDSKRNFNKEKEATMNKYRKHMRALMLLIHENDLLPEESGVYSDKDA